MLGQYFYIPPKLSNFVFTLCSLFISDFDQVVFVHPPDILYDKLLIWDGGLLSLYEY